MLRKGENAALDGGRVRVAVTAAGTPIDVSAVLLGDDRRVRSDDDLVFFNHPAQDGVRLEGAEVVIDLDGMPADVSTIALAASVDGPGTFDGVPLRADVHGGPWFEAPAMSAGETVAVVVEVYRRAGAWKVRAVGQGWASGLAGLATDFGVDVTDERPPEVDLRKRISLRKETVRVSLEKKGIGGLRARVAVVLDASGSMRRLFKEGVVAEIVERMAAIALQVDDDGALDAWIFATEFARLPPLRVAEIEAWTHDNVRMHEAVAADGSRVSLGGRNNEPQVIEDILAFYEARQGEPALVLFFSDGGVAKNAQIARLLREASNRPVFWQFIGLGHGRYGILEKLDTLDGRLIDNAGFFAVDDIANITDTELYQRIFSEFPSWLKSAKAHGLPLGSN
ncbi:VWA domain-containing protein [Actinomadura luteofluorescens]|uniref:VWA domain-containing protein n=1 Tax=Actinomadura luteofluorescens TaxID=46163 RepID=UPI002164A772|nr:VWA domain-containing protein [Actinomadura glauciflava]MCR3743990.1 Stress response protein SCP2 [Actinomadura glauciflava]